MEMFVKVTRSPSTISNGAKNISVYQGPTASAVRTVFTHKTRVTCCQA